MPRRPHLILPAGLLIAGLLTGCSRVELVSPQPDAVTAAICQPLLAALPDAVLDQDRRATTGGSLTTAWGDPAITLRCGVAVPDGLGPTSVCLEVNGVGWYESVQAGGSLFTSYGRTANVEVAVPAAYAPESGALADVAAAVSAHDPLQQPCVG